MLLFLISNGLHRLQTMDGVGQNDSAQILSCPFCLNAHYKVVKLPHVTPLLPQFWVTKALLNDPTDSFILVQFNFLNTILSGSKCL